MPIRVSVRTSSLQLVCPHAHERTHSISSWQWQVFDREREPAYQRSSSRARTRPGLGSRLTNRNAFFLGFSTFSPAAFHTSPFLLSSSLSRRSSCCERDSETNRSAHTALIPSGASLLTGRQTSFLPLFLSFQLTQRRQKPRGKLTYVFEV